MQSPVSDDLPLKAPFCRLVMYAWLGAKVLESAGPHRYRAVHMNCPHKICQTMAAGYDWRLLGYACLTDLILTDSYAGTHVHLEFLSCGACARDRDGLAARARFGGPPTLHGGQLASMYVLKIFHLSHAALHERLIVCDAARCVFCTGSDMYVTGCNDGDLTFQLAFIW